MTNLRTLLITSAALVLTAMSAQAAPAAGAYKLAIGSGAACPVTLAADGSVAVVGDCASGHIAKWESKADGVELFTASGETVAVLKVKNNGYAGTRFADGRSLVLSTDTASVAQSH